MIEVVSFVVTGVTAVVLWMAISAAVTVLAMLTVGTVIFTFLAVNSFIQWVVGKLAGSWRHVRGR